VTLDQAYLDRDGVRFQLSPGMQVSAEINLGSRTVNIRASHPR
jgi:multidrug efflux pump subunit AcrA (membrane-fusion protein)